MYQCNMNIFILDGSLHAKRSQSIHLKSSFRCQMITTENNRRCHHHINALKDAFSYVHQQLPNMAHHISVPSLELVHNNKINSLNLTHSSFECTNIRKKQPRTNPNYVNIQVKTNDGSLRHRYIRINDVQGSQTSTCSSTSTNSSCEQNSITCNSQPYFDESNRYFPSNETISTVKTNHEQRSDIIINEKSSLPTNMNENKINNTHTLTNKGAVIMKQLISCTGGKSIFCYNKYEKSITKKKYLTFRICFSFDN